jgi:hypothetical protein
MRPELERLQRIEGYLLHNPQAEKTADWRVQELLDADLAFDTEIQRRLYQGLRAAGQQQLRRELTSIHQQLYGSGQESWAAQLLARLADATHQLLRFLPSKSD